MGQTANAQQIEHWNGPQAEKWVRGRATLDAILAPFEHVLLERAALAPGMRCIDVGCGCGTTTFAIGDAVGRGAGVTGIDLSAPMLAHARERARERASGEDFVEGDASRYPFPEGRADRVLSRFGVMFFDAPEEAFAHIRGWLAEGGRLVFVCWQAPSHNAWIRVPVEAALAHLPEMAPPPSDAPGPFALADRERLASLLAGAGFGTVDIAPIECPMEIEGDLEVAVRFLAERQPLSRAMAEAEPAQAERARRAIAEAIAPHHDGARVALTGAVWCVDARR